MTRYAALLWLTLATPAMAQEVGQSNSSYADGILVTTNDVTTCPYRTIGPVRVSATVEFSSSTQQPSMFAKLRLKAAKLGADAVVLVNVSGKRITAFSWGKRDAIGRAIQYVDRNCAPKI